MLKIIILSLTLPFIFSSHFIHQEALVEDSLRKNPELIPLEPVLGGTMNFRNIQFLSNHWILAEFDDGHIEGKALYTYSVNEKGELEFKLLQSFTDQ